MKLKIKKLTSIIFIVAACLTLLCSQAYAANVQDLTATYNNGEVTVSGKTSALAVAVVLDNGDNDKIVTAGVKDGTFTTKISNVTLANGKYTVKAADFDGGNYAVTELNVGDSKDKIPNTSDNKAIIATVVTLVASALGIVAIKKFRKD